MDRRRLEVVEAKKNDFFSCGEMGFQWIPQEECLHTGGLFASIGQVGMGFGVSPNPPKVENGVKIPYTDLYVKYVTSPESGFRIVQMPNTGDAVEAVEEGVIKKKRGGLKLKVKIGNPSLRRLVSGAIAGAVSRTAVAPLETIRTHLMVGSSGNSSTEVFQNIMKVDGWKGLFRGNFVNVIRVAPSKAIEELVEKLGIYMVAYDRAGYGESDPNPNRSMKSEVFDLQELADQLELGQRFYVIGMSMGGCTIWGCLKYIPHRLAGAALIVPVINYWWPSIPSNLSKKASGNQPYRDLWALRAAHYVPRLYSWVTKRWFNTPDMVKMNPAVFGPIDTVVLNKMLETEWKGQETPMQQGVFESLHRDILVGFGSWEFDPLDIKNPYENNESSVHIWQGYEDRMVPVLLQRYVSERLPWIKYHEVQNAGHLIAFTDDLFDVILKSLLIGQDPSSM